MQMYLQLLNDSFKIVHCVNLHVDHVSKIAMQ